MKTAKITEIWQANKWDWPHWAIYYIPLTLDNGEKIRLGKQKEDAFKVWDTVSYEVVEEWKKWKEVKENPFRAWANNQANSKAAKIWMAIKVAFDLVYKDKWLDEAKKLTKEILLFATELEWEDKSDSPSN